MNKTIGYLSYNSNNNRYGMLVMDLWEIEGFHCGEVVEVFIDDQWVHDRIEMSDEWYLVNSELKGLELEGLKVRMNN